MCHDRVTKLELGHVLDMLLWTKRKLSQELFLFRKWKYRQESDKNFFNGIEISRSAQTSQSDEL